MKKVSEKKIIKNTSLFKKFVSLRQLFEKIFSMVHRSITKKHFLLNIKDRDPYLSL